jgi:Ser/Thr protein kinase RdoA (MazF antagonist)
MPTQETPLPGGIANAGAVVRVGDTVRRPAPPNADSISTLLGFLRDQGFDGAPGRRGLDELGREVLTFIPGRVALPPFPAWSTSAAALESVARLLRRYHDATVNFVHAGATWSTAFADPTGEVEVMCHNDVCPENVVFAGRQAVALLDFDFAAPGRRIWDVARTLRMWAPLSAPSHRVNHSPELDALTRTTIFCGAYRISPQEASTFVATLNECITVGTRFVRDRVAANDPAFVNMWNMGGGEDRALADRAWLKANEQSLADAAARGSSAGHST